MKTKISKQDLWYHNELIKECGSAKKAAEALEISPQAFYDRLKLRGIPAVGNKRKFYHEPQSVVEKTDWMAKLLDGKTVGEVADKLHCHPNTVRVRMHQCGIYRTNRGVEPVGLQTREQRIEWLRELLQKHGNAYRVAKALGVKPQAIYERMERYGLKG
jgi:hypothetical protein